MKISAVQNTENNKTQVQNTNQQKYSHQTNYLSQQAAKDTVSFNGIGSKAANGANKIFKFIDRSSFFVEFLIIDTLSMVAPRIAMGLLRDREQLGHLNWKAAKEEAGREVLSGPSMNLIPMGILTAVSAAKPAARMERNDLTYLSEIAKSAIKDNKGQELSSRQIAEKIFDSNFKSAGEEKEAFIELLEKTTSTKGKERKEAVSKFSEMVSKLNNKMSDKVAAVHTDRLKYNLDDKLAEELKLKNGSISAGDLADSFKAFKKDIITKINKAGKSTTEEACNLVEKLKMNRSHIKLATALTAFLAVGSFLKVLPKLYQQKGLSPAQESALRASGQLPKDGGNA